MWYEWYECVKKWNPNFPAIWGWRLEDHWREESSWAFAPMDCKDCKRMCRGFVSQRIDCKHFLFFAWTDISYLFRISNLWIARKLFSILFERISFFDFFRLVRWSTDQPAPCAHSLPLHLPKNVWIFSHSHFLFCIFFSLCTIAFCWKFLLSMEERILSQAFSHATIKFITSGRIILVTRGPVTIQTVSF